MKPVFAVAPLLFVLAGCPTPYAAELPAVPALTAAVGELVDVPTASVSRMEALYAPAPSPAEIESARCDDESVCEVTKTPPYRVAGKRPGKTTLTLVLIHPFDQTKQQRRVAAAFLAPTVRELALGDEYPACGHPNELAPSGKEGAAVRCELRDYPLPDGKKATYVCDPADTLPRRNIAERLDLGNDVRGNARSFSCRQKDAVPWEPRPSRQDWLIVCEDVPLGASTKSKAFWVYRAQGEPMSPTLSLVEKRGETREVCALR